MAKASYEDWFCDLTSQISEDELYDLGDHTNWQAAYDADMRPSEAIADARVARFNATCEMHGGA